MSIIFKSLIGTLAAASMLACTAGTTLYLWRCVEFAIHDAIAHQVAEMQSEEGVCHLGIESAEDAPFECAGFEEMNQPPHGALLDSNVVAVLIDELSEASPEEREVWTQLLRRPDSHESLRDVFSYYHGKPTQNVERTGHQVPAASMVERPPISPSRSLPGNGFPEAAHSTAMIESAIEAVRTARQLLLEKVMNDELAESSELYNRLIEGRQPSQPHRDAPDKSSESSASLPE